MSDEDKLKWLLEIEKQPDSFWESTHTLPTPFNDAIFQDASNPMELKYRLLSFNFMLAGDFQKAYNYCNQGLENNPKSAFLYYVRGRILGDAGMLENGATDLVNAVTLKPDFVDAYVELGHINAKLGDKKESEKCYEIARKLDPNVKLPSD